MIYFIQAGDGDIKIGTAKDPGRRLRELQPGNSIRLRVLGVMSGGRREEQNLHRRFAAHRAEAGEWFHPAAEILQFVKERGQQTYGNEVEMLGDGRIQILFFRPVEPTMGSILSLGGFNVKVLIDKAGRLCGIMGRSSTLRQLFGELGLEKAFEEVMDVLSLTAG